MTVDLDENLDAHAERSGKLPRGDALHEAVGCSAMAKNVRDNVCRQSCGDPNTLPRADRTVYRCASEVYEMALSAIKTVPSSKVRKYTVTQLDGGASFFGLDCTTFFPLHDASFKIHHRPLQAGYHAASAPRVPPQQKEPCKVWSASGVP